MVGKAPASDLMTAVGVLHDELCEDSKEIKKRKMQVHFSCASLVDRFPP